MTRMTNAMWVAGILSMSGLAFAEAPRDASTGLATGKRMHKPVTAESEKKPGAKAQQTSPRDPQSGLPTGKRMHKEASPGANKDATAAPAPSKPADPAPAPKSN